MFTRGTRFWPTAISQWPYFPPNDFLFVCLKTNEIPCFTHPIHPFLSLNHDKKNRETPRFLKSEITSSYHLPKSSSDLNHIIPFSPNFHRHFCQASWRSAASSSPDPSPDECAPRWAEARRWCRFAAPPPPLCWWLGRPRRGVAGAWKRKGNHRMGPPNVMFVGWFISPSSYIIICVSYIVVYLNSTYIISYWC